MMQLQGGDRIEYTIQNLARLSGISTRTLRYYDQIGLLKPARINSSGYRIYGQAETDRLQQILFFRELGFQLENIREIVMAPDFDALESLQRHHTQLAQKRAQIDTLLANVEKTIASMKGDIMMKDPEKFEGFKQKLIDENETKYGAEIRERYGNDAVERSNRKIKNMTPEQHARITALNEELTETLRQAFEEGDPSSPLAQKAADLHRQWLTFYWDHYSPEAHAGLAQMYVEDSRFTAYYDAIRPGLTPFLRDAILIYTGKKI